MTSTVGLVPITREFLASYYDKHPFEPLSEDLLELSSNIRSLSSDLIGTSSLTEEESYLVEQADRSPPHKMDENIWKNREQLEEICFLLDKTRCPIFLQDMSSDEDRKIASILENLRVKTHDTLKSVMNFQAKNSERVFNIVMTYVPQDFRGTLIRQQRERSERNKQAEVDDLVNSGGIIREKYALLWKQQMERRRQLAQLGSATGVYKTLVKYLVGVPEVLLEFVQKINDDDGPMEEQRQRYGPPLYQLTTMIFRIRLYISCLWNRLSGEKLDQNYVNILENAIGVYSSECERYITFMGNVLANSPFLISAEEAGSIKGLNNEDYKELIIAAGKAHEVLLSVDTINSYIAWDFSLIQGKMNMDIGFSVEYMDPNGKTTLILPYRRYSSDQGNFSTCMSGNYKLIWDNTYSTFFKKVLRYKVDCIPPVADTVQTVNGIEG